MSTTNKTKLGPTHPHLVYWILYLFICLLLWWAGNCSITESLPELIQQVRQELWVFKRMRTAFNRTAETKTTDFFYKTIKSIKRENNLFTLIDSSHNLRKIRNIIKEYKCHTSRFQRSSLPFLAKLANSGTPV